MTPTNVKPSHVRKYLNEYALIVCVIAIVTLFRMYISMNDFIKDELKELVIKSTIAIDKNNQLLNSQK